jgi:mannosyl-glycoprotein endo-beta-N-acetylglucosaminidase
MTSRMSYCVHIVYKTVACEGTDLDLGLFVKSLITDGKDLPKVEVGASTQSELKHGWTKQVLTFSLPNHATNALVAIGLIVGFAAKDPSQSLDFSISLGQFAVYPSTATTSALKGTLGILWAKFQSTKSITAPLIDFSGLLTWDIACSFPHLTMETIPSSEDPNPVWILDDTKERFPSFLYFNIYVVPHPRSGSVAGPEAAVFIGTTGLDGRANRFYVDSSLLSRSVMGGRGLRFHVQGVTDRGDVLPWDLCAYVDHIFDLGSHL